MIFNIKFIFDKKAFFSNFVFWVRVIDKRIDQQIKFGMFKNKYVKTDIKVLKFKDIALVLECDFEFKLMLTLYCQKRQMIV